MATDPAHNSSTQDIDETPFEQTHSGIQLVLPGEEPHAIAHEHAKTHHPHSFGHAYSPSPTDAPHDSNDVFDGNQDSGVVMSRQSSVATYSSTLSWKYEGNVYSFFIWSFFNPEHRCLAAFLIVGFYVTLLGLVGIISLTMVDRVNSNSGSLSEMCQRNDDGFMCRPNRIHDIMNFDLLDNFPADGIWTVVEARRSNLLQQFRTLHDIAMDSPLLLEALAPPQDPEPDVSCILLVHFKNSMAHLSETDKTEVYNVLQAKGQLSQNTINACQSENISSAYTLADLHECYKATMCSDFFSSPGKTSQQVYQESTQQFSIISRDLHSRFRDNFLKPCLLVDADLCSNAEYEGSLTQISMWQALTPNERVNACKDFVATKCPALLGSTFALFQTNLDSQCGDRSYTPVEVPPSAPVGSRVSHKLGSGHCQDNHTLAVEYLAMLYALTPVWNYMMKGVELWVGLPVGSLDHMWGCPIMKQLGMQHRVASIPSYGANGTLAVRAIGFLECNACRESCCDPENSAYGCQSQCATQSTPVVSTLVGKAWCVGELCSDKANISIIGDRASGTITIKASPSIHGGTIEWGGATIFIESEVYLRVYILDFRLPSDMVDSICESLRLTIDGHRVCTANIKQNRYVDIPRRNHGLVEISWLQPFACSVLDGSCGFVLSIVDIGEPNTYVVDKLSFSEADKYTDGFSCILSMLFAAFITLITAYWVCTMLGETWSIRDVSRFVLGYPAIPIATRICWFLVVILPRIVICFSVFILGILLLMLSDGYIDIVLNGVALAFILDLDEILFTTIAPSTIVGQLEEEKTFEWKRSGLDEKLHAMITARFSSWSSFYHGLLVVVIPVFISSALYYTLFLEYFGIIGYVNTSAMLDCLCMMHGERCQDVL